MHEEVLVGLALVGVLSIAAQWVSWRLKLPSILLLLVFGIFAGPVTGILNVDELMGDLLFPVISLSVAIILFEGGLSLRLSDLPEIGRVVRNLITLGVVLTWIISAVTAHLVLNLDWQMSFLIGAILVVTGPTVVIPLLNQIRPVPRVSSILRWEGIVIDPVGAILTVLVFEEILAANASLGGVIWGLVTTVGIGLVFGWVSAKFLIEAFSRYWVPDNLQNPVVLMMIVAALTVSNVLRPESGLLTVTIMGILMANQKQVDMRHVVEFKENLQVVLISGIFILLGARLEFEALRQLGWGVVIFTAMIMLVERPLSVLIATYRSGLTWREKLFIAWMAPRGIVAASVASIFALELAGEGHEGSELLVPVTFSVIITTVAIYSLTSGLLAKWLGLVQRNPQGVLMIGSHSWAREIALKIKEAGFRILLVDTNIQNISRAQAAGLEVHHGNILNDSITDDVDLSGIGKLIAMTPNDEVNSLASMHFKEVIGSDCVFQLPRHQNTRSSVSLRLGGGNLFGENVTYEYLSSRFRKGAHIDIFPVDEAWAGKPVIPLFLVTPDGELKICTADNPPPIREGQKVIGLVDPGLDEAAPVASTQIAK